MQLLQKRITLKEESNLLAPETGQSQCLSDGACTLRRDWLDSRIVRVFSSLNNSVMVWLSLFTSHCPASLTVTACSQQISQTSKAQKCRGYLQGVCTDVWWEHGTCWEPGTSHAWWGRRPKKGGCGLKALLETFRKTYLQEMSWTQLQKKNRQPAAAGKACQGREAKQRVGWTFMRLACLSSPPLDLKSKYLATQRWPPRVEGVHLPSAVWRRINFWVRSVTDLISAAPSPVCWASSHPKQLTIYPMKFSLEFTCLCLQNTEFCLIQRFWSLAFSASKNTMDYFEDGKKRRWTSLFSACLCLLCHSQPHFILLCAYDSKQTLILVYGLN